MATYHDLDSVFEAVTGLLDSIAQRERLADAELRSWRTQGSGIPVVTLKWKGEESIHRNIHFSVLDEPTEAIAEIEVNAWFDTIVTRRRGKPRPRRVRRMVSTEVGTIHRLERLETYRVLIELSSLLSQAFSTVSEIQPEDLQETERDPRGDDPGPIELESWLGE